MQHYSEFLPFASIQNPSAVSICAARLPASLLLIVPPLQLVSAAQWEIVKQGAVMYYALLEEFITTVLEIVPELLTSTHTHTQSTASHHALYVQGKE